MLSFVNDYSEGAHESILKRLLETNMEKLPGYGTDVYCETAKEKIRLACDCPNADIYFLVGGTQTNKVIISSLLASYQGVIAACTGHIGTHEAGAIEDTGHKVLELPQTQGKISASKLKEYLNDFYSDENHDHMVFPGMVYISYPTEYGTLYTKQELIDIHMVCSQFEIPLYIDGARLGYGLASEESDVTISDIAKFSDVFYIGGTKIGALCGEAVVFTKNNTPNHFVTLIKRQGALLAKGRLLGIQFDTLFTNNLYHEISKNAIQTANALKKGLQAKGYSFFLDSPTNQIFIIVENSQLEILKQKVAFSFWEKIDDTHTIIRFATSWATKMNEVNALINLL
ncbi:Low specificity L-threonine aldolase [Clostridiales bacterium CHKCI001]|nr:Low specificity L-threonine aldolase [Clostridiales bacterium CHKCI001]